MGSMITTVDNPYDPRTDFQAWDQWDRANGYNTCAYLDRVAIVAEDVPQTVQHGQIELAMDEIIAIHNGGLYKKLPIDDS